MSFSLFGQTTADDIRVGYVDPELGYVEGVTICEANNYAKNNPGTTFIFTDGSNSIRYLNINEVNRLTPNDLIPSDEECGGIQNYTECGPTVIQFYGGGGIGAVGNPVVGVDGSLLAVDVISGGHAYQYPPFVSATDNCQKGNGAVLVAVLGQTPDQIEVYEGEEDFEDYEICEPDDIGYGLQYGNNGEELGEWDPSYYTEIGVDPIQREIEQFQKAVQKPFWTTREAQPDRVYTVEKSYATQETISVTHPEWGEFMNQYAVSPVKPSDVTGSDESGRIFSMEWELNFPISGEYIFRGVCDNTAQVYVDGGLVGNLKGFKDNPSPLQKTVTEGNHIVKVDLLNVPITEKVTTTTANEVDVAFTITGDGLNTNKMKFSFVSDSKTFTLNGNPKGGQSRTETIKVNPSTRFKISVSSTKSGGVEQGIVKNGTKNKEGGEGESNRIFGDHIQSDNDNDDIQITTNIGTFKATNKRTSPDGRSTFDLFFEVGADAGSATSVVGEVISPKSWNTNPMGVSMIIDAPSPPVPQEQIPPPIGECPPNPIWTTRFPGASQQWYPVNNETWSTFLNRYAISPVLPLESPGSDGSGIIHTNSWQFDAPYAGYYKFQVQRDNTARIYVDGKIAFDVTTSGDEKWVKEGLVGKVKSQKVFLEKGRHTISIELENTPQQTSSIIDTKIFSTQDWRTSSTSTPSQVDVTFNVSEAGSDGSSIEISEVLTVNETRDGDNITKKIEAGKAYNVKAFPGNRKLKSDGSILRLEDSTDNDFNDLVIRASQGKFYDVNGNTAKFIVEDTNSTSTSISKNGVSYSGPKIFGYNDKRWSKYMNEFSVSPQVSQNIGKFTLTWSNVNFPYSGLYKFNFQADNNATLTVGGREILKTSDFIGEKVQYTFNATPGKYDVVIELENLSSGGKQDEIFTSNPMGVALFISKDVVFSDSNKTSWTTNPVAISAILIPPPCAKKIGGKGVVEKVIIQDPGNGHPTQPGEGYPVILVLDEVIVENPGINYSCGEDQIQITPSNGSQLSYSCDSFGRITNVKVKNPGSGFNVYPEITMVSPPGNVPTGVNASFRPVFRVVRDPILPPEQAERIIQVTDLVGLKQTGYVEGRAYYGAVYYDEGIPYAGYYKTVGPQTRVYATLQESITARVTTRPSAIQRSGTDIRSNDPRLNIPGTPQSTSEQ